MSLSEAFPEISLPARQRGSPHPGIVSEQPLVLMDLVAQLLPEGQPIARDEALALLRRHLGRIQARVQEAFEARELSGLAAARWLAALTDTLMVGIHRYTEALHSPDRGEKPYALVATGGYGRGVLAPFSDIDLLFLTDNSMGARGRKAVEFMLYLLWDLGLKVGHATRSRSECLQEAKRDATVMTALLDARLVAGDQAIFARFDEAFRTARART
ncbi:MAG: nucleotidyltransferase domain-containing protein, partial [Alphaproteobacteria bacterium]